MKGNTQKQPIRFLLREAMILRVICSKNMCKAIQFIQHGRGEKTESVRGDLEILPNWQKPRGACTRGETGKK